MGGAGWKFSWGAQDDQASAATIHRALDQGVNWIDTAPVYGTGHAEEVVGKTLQGMSERPFIATKCGRRWNEERVPYGNLKRESVIGEVEDSLRRLHLECIDLYQMHWPLPEEDIEEAWSAMGECVKAGKVRLIGVCNFNVAQLKRIMPIHHPASLQPPYSMLARDIENELLPFCAAEGIGVIAYSPLQKGILTDKFSRQFVEALAADDHRRGDPRFQEPQLSRNLAAVEKLKAIARRRGISVAQLALAWVLRRSELTAAIAGGRSPEQVQDTLAAAQHELSPEDIVAVEEVLNGWDVRRISPPGSGRAV
jgi:aryl-alcohol dehydrogenase-like predicted oxidoreductase